MKIKIILILLITGCHSIIHAQSISTYTIASTGINFSNDNLSISSTLGDLMIKTLQSTDLILTQGFQQPLLLGTGISKNTYLWDIKTYPNPVTKELSIIFQLEKPSDLNLNITDLTGKRILIQELKNFPAQYEYNLDLSNLKNGIYILKIYSADYKIHQVIKIEKQQLQP